MAQQNIGLKILINGLQKFSQIQYNGRLKIKCPTGQAWSLYFRLGRMIWATGGVHPFRRWRRHMNCYLPNISLSDITLNNQEIELEYWDYILLTKLFKQNKVKHEQVKKVVTKTILEILFDISQQSLFNYVVGEPLPNNIFDPPISLVNLDFCLKIIMQSRKAWTEAGLAILSPNSAPLINQAEQLKKMLNPAVYKNIVNLANGKYTLRDLTIKMKKNEFTICRFFLPYITKGVVKLVEVPDLLLRINQSPKQSIIPKTKTAKVPLIACVDDNPQICKVMEKIILSHGLRFISITDSKKALSILMQHKPDLIFLDLVMPVVNGYEICTHLRRTSIFKHRPVIILSASEGLVDKVRTKMIGANYFINKPIVIQKVLEMIYKYLYSQPTVPQVQHK